MSAPTDSVVTSDAGETVRNAGPTANAPAWDTLDHKHASACHPERSEEPALSLPKGSLCSPAEETLRCAQGDGLKPSSSVGSALRTVTSDAGETVRDAGPTRNAPASDTLDRKHGSACHPERSEKAALNLPKGSVCSAAEEALRCAQGDGWKPSGSVVTSDAGETVRNADPTGNAVVRPGSRNLNPADIGFLSLLAEDLRTHGGNLFEQGFWAVATHRFGNWRMGVPKVFRLPCTLLYRFGFKWVEWTCGITLPYTVQLGRRVRIWHHSGMILHANRIGNDVHIRQNTTFGIARKDTLHELPVIEDRVDLGCGVAVLGPVTIGHDSTIGANAVVVKDVPPYSVAVGVPAKVIKNCQSSVVSGQL
jgi:serine O-acetyltransferase